MRPVDRARNVPMPDRIEAPAATMSLADQGADVIEVEGAAAGAKNPAELARSGTFVITCVGDDDVLDKIRGT